MWPLRRIRRSGVIRVGVILGLATLGWLEASAQSSRLLPNPAGGLYFSDEQNIYALDPLTNRLTLLLENRGASKLGFDAAGRLCGRQLRYDAAHDIWRPTIWRLTGSNETTEIAVDSPGAKFAVTDVAAANGNMYFWECDRSEGFSRLLVRRGDGPVTLLAGHRWGARDGRGFEARLGNVGGITAAADGTIYFCDGPAVRKVAPDGTVATIATGGLLNGRDPSAHNSITPNPLSFIAVDRLNYLYVADQSTGALLRVSPEGEVVALGDDATRQWSPEGLAANDGAVYVAESKSGNFRVRRLELAGMTGGTPSQPVVAATKRPARGPVWLSQRAEGVVPVEIPKPDLRSNLLPTSRISR